jgi:hypothetical protein
MPTGADATVTGFDLSLIDPRLLAAPPEMESSGSDPNGSLFDPGTATGTASTDPELVNFVFDPWAAAEALEFGQFIDLEGANGGGG